jgi:hypothetical protein
MSEYNYFENEEYKRVEVLMNETEVLTFEEYELVNNWFPAFAKDMLFHNFWNNTYLNLNVYSEVEKEEYDLRKEMGY